MQIKGNRFLITGGAGLMGSHITDRLLAGGAAEVILLDNFVRGSLRNIEEALKDKRVRLVEGDIRDLDLLRDLATGIDGLFHMAALRITACADDPTGGDGSDVGRDPQCASNGGGKESG